MSFDGTEGEGEGGTVKKRIAVAIAAVGSLLVAGLGSTVAAQSSTTTIVYPPTTVEGESSSTAELTIGNVSITVTWDENVPEEFQEGFATATSEDVDGQLTFTVSVPCQVPNVIAITFNGETVEATCESVTSDSSAGTSGFLLTPSLDGVGSVRFQTSDYIFDGIATATFDAPTVAGDYVVTVVDLVSGFETAVTLTFEAVPGGTASGDGIDLATILPVVVGLLVVGLLIFNVAARRRSEAETLA